MARRLLQRLDEDDLAEIRADKTQKKELERLQKKYNDNFEKGEYSNYHGKETWHYWVKAATSLVDLDKKITAVIDAAVRSKALSPAPAKQQSQVPPKSASGPSPSVSSPVVSSPPPSPRSSSPVVPSLPPSPGSAASGPDKPKKKGKEFVELTRRRSRHLPRRPGGPGMNLPRSSPSAYRPPPLTSDVDARNADVATLINRRPPGAVRVVGQYRMTDDTIYFPLTVTEAPTMPPGYQQQIQRVWNLEIHYHPVPTTTNCLHVKMRAGTSAQNVLPNNNWLVDRTVFRDALIDWNSQKPDRQSVHNW